MVALSSNHPPPPPFNNQHHGFNNSNQQKQQELQRRISWDNEPQNMQIDDDMQIDNEDDYQPEFHQEGTCFFHNDFYGNGL